jgi:hypothetical protein
MREYVPQQQIAVHVFNDLRWSLGFRQQSCGLHDLPGVAVTALRHLLGWFESNYGPSMVVTLLLATCKSYVWHERTALPSRWTVQAQHSPAPQPNFVPVSLRCSRTIQRSSVWNRPQRSRVCH